MEFASTLKAVRWFFQGLFDESPHSLAFAIQHWADGVFDDDPGLRNALQSMSTAVSIVLEQLNLAQIIRGENEGVLVWLMELKDAAYAADDLLSELDYYRLHQQADEFQARSRRRRRQRRRRRLRLSPTDEDQASTSSHKDSRYNIVRRMYENVGRLGTITTSLSSVLSLLKLVENFQPSPHDLPVASHRMTTSFSSSTQTVIGRDSERDQIIKSLLLPTPTSVSMIPIVGMGGIGKTTLAKMVYNHEEIKKHFERRIWLCVSDNFDVARLTREILEELGVPHGFDHTTNVNELQELLMKKLQSVRYLLVLDDVWNESEREKWGSLCEPLQSQKGGSRLLVTTRLNTVVNIASKNMDMLHQCQLEGLSEEIYLFFFNICAFGDEPPGSHPSLVDIAKQIAARLKGSPLAAKTVGGLLRESLDEDHWRSVLNSPIWQLPQCNDDITPALQLSYQHLPPHLQQCFIYCSVFPKDRQFEKDEMVGMWISQGYVHAKSIGNKSVEEIGSEYFDNLLSRSFIQANDEEKYFLHDLLHDLAESVSENEYLKVNSKQRKEITSSVRHLHVHSNDLGLLKSCNLSNLHTLIIDGDESDDLRNLRTLIIDGDESDDCSVLKEVLDGLKSICVLILNNVTEQLLSGSIGHLTHLRYLAVYCKKSGESLVSGEGASALPAATSSMVSLRPYHLQWLISGKGGLALPAAAKYLVSLRHFGSIKKYPWRDYDYIWEEFALMPGIGKLTCLQELDRFSVGKTEGRKLAELKRLNDLKGTLKLRSLHNASTKEEALEANLNKKEGIRALVLACGNGHATPHMAEEVFEGLCPPPCIKKLSIEYYVGVESPTWMMTVNCCLSVLQSLELYKCFNWKVLPPLGQLPLLSWLKIDGAAAVEEIGSNFYGSGVAKSFPSLETIKFRNMPEWVVWSGVEEDIDSLFPQLRELCVLSCPKLKGVPMQCLASVEVLKTNCMLLLGELEKLTSLKKLVVTKICDPVSASLVSVGLKSLPSLQKLIIQSNDNIRSVPLLPATLVELTIIWCGLITAFSGEQEENLSDLTSLQKIEIYGCPQLRFLPPMPASLQELTIWKCPELPRERYQEGEDNWHKISHVCTIRWQ